MKLADPGIFDAMRKSIARRARNQKAPYHCIAAVEAACTLPFDEGCRREAELFKELENSDEARPCAMRSSPSAKWRGCPIFRPTRRCATSPMPQWWVPERWAAASP